MEKIDLLIHAPWIITCEDQSRTLKDHALAIKDSKIYAILPSKEAKHLYDAAKEETYTHHVITPGFINSHTHLAMNAFRGYADDLALLDWLNNHIWPAEGKWVNDEFVYDMSQLAIGEMIRGGTLCFNDMYFYMKATARAAEEACIRAHIGMNIIDVPTSFAQTIEENFAKAIDFYDMYKHNHYVVPTMAPHSTYTVSIEDLAKAKLLADDYRLKVNIHLQESANEVEQSLKLHGKRPLQRLYDIGFIDTNTIAMHMTQIDDNDFRILQETRPSIVHCPESNMKLVSGACPIQTLHQIGINVALGTDGAASNNDLDMFGEMRTAAFLGKLTAQDPKAASAEQILKMATINGAKALGIDHFTGSLQPGKSADFITIDMDELATQPLYHPISQLVYATSRNQVTNAWVMGKQLMKNRELLTLDEHALLKKAKKWQGKISSQ